MSRDAFGGIYTQKDRVTLAQIGRARAARLRRQKKKGAEQVREETKTGRKRRWRG